MDASNERMYDEYERMAIAAIMREGAHRAKRPKAGDLFKRPKDGEASDGDLSELKKETERLNDWLASLRPNNGGKEETDGIRHTR